MDPTPIKNIDPNSIEYKTKEIKRRAYDLMYSSARSDFLLSKKDKKTFLKTITKKICKLVPEFTQDIIDKFSTIDHMDEKDEEDFLTEVVNTIIQVIARHLSLSELESRLRTREVKGKGLQELSRALLCKIIMNRVHLHMPVNFFESPESVVKSIKEGLVALARKIKSEEQFKDVEKIIGFSSLVKEKPRFLVKLGFNVVLDKDNKPVGEINISKEKLLEMYGK